MNSRPRTTLVLLPGLLALLALNCQVTAQLIATPTPTLTATPTSTPTLTPTASPTPRPDLSAYVLELEDFPPGFEELTLEELGLTMDDFNNEGFEPEQVFVFVNPRQFQMVIGFNFLLTDRLNRISFDAVASDPELFLPAFVSGVGPENVSEVKVMTGMEDIGEMQIGIRMLAETEGIALNVETLIFRRDILGALLMSMNMQGRVPNVPLADLGQALDRRFLEYPSAGP